ncbi:acetate kinase, putative [Babesia ovata]|uniref:Acetate kinase, putative n=1 Tax=Babesia ovata TaxID=189622 RepID=A0A2H6KBE6_9APIC|nr:acetate kinase, putative [Babesia ovata]GBE60305.1 acetate kinase, putative [Babesia ovata]
MANSILVTRRGLLGIMLILAFLKPSTAQINVKHPATLFNEHVRLYVNGQQVNFDELERRTSPSDEQIYVASSAYVATKTFFLRSAIARYKAPHPVKPYLEKIVGFLLHKLAEEGGDSFLTFESVQICREYVKSLKGVLDGFKSTPTFKCDVPHYYDSVLQFYDATVTIDKSTMDTLMLMCQHMYVQCSDKLQKLATKKADGQPGGNIVTAPPSFQGSNDARCSEEATVSGATSSVIAEELPLSSPQTITASPYVKGSLGAWKPGPSGSTDHHHTSDEISEPSDDDRHLSRHSSVSMETPEQQDDTLSYYSAHGEAGEENAADWDKYFDSFLERLRISPEDGEAENEANKPLSRWQRLLKCLRRLMCISRGSGNQ